MPAAALQAIASYVVEEPEFDDIAALEAGLRSRLTGYAPVTDEQWRRLAEHEARVQPNGKLKFGYDPAIGAALKAAPVQDVDLWPIYDRIACPTLLLRGGESNLLTARHRARDDDARTARETGGIPRRGACSAADGGGPDRGGSRLPRQRLILHEDYR